MTRPRSDSRSGASPRPGRDAAALRRELYRPGADGATVRAYLEAAEAEGLAPAAVEPPPPPVPPAAPGPTGRSRWRRMALPAAIAVAVPAVGIALLPRPSPVPHLRPSSSRPAVAPTTIDGLKGASTLLVALPFRTSRVRVRLECGGRGAAYRWTALGRDAQTQQYIPVLEHAGDSCSPGATYVGPLPGDVDALRMLVVVDGPYAVSIDPL